MEVAWGWPLSPGCCVPSLCWTPVTEHTASTSPRPPISGDHTLLAGPRPPHVRGLALEDCRVLAIACAGQSVTRALSTRSLCLWLWVPTGSKAALPFLLPVVLEARVLKGRETPRDPDHSRGLPGHLANLGCQAAVRSHQRPPWPTTGRPACPAEGEGPQPGPQRPPQLQPRASSGTW